ncbi:MAG: 1-acyl-sn-glycerol-3-phosphate acyltransferase [Oligoflexia bacterium]|nr:1-acyl-sn-glycerol-3-phosphate acyltransferase [Oligoflexia bacterium]
MSNGANGSHPTIRFQSVPVVEGRLFDFDKIRLRVLAEVLNRTVETFASADHLDHLLGEALYLERVRLKREKPNLFTRSRIKGDRALWSQVRGGLLQSPVQADRKALLRAVVKHYVEEIGGHFNPKTYRFATSAVPWGFSWLLNAASVRHFLPWGLTQSLESRLRIVGEVPALQRLSRQGTILLVPTHQSNIDSMLVGYVIYLMSLPPFSYGAGLNLFSNPVLSYFMSGLGAYTVDRKKSNVLYKETLKNYSTTILREGVHSIFFPGGGRSRSGAVESRLKLGLLGTALEAQIGNLQRGVEKPNIYVVPMVMSYHFVLEAASLIEDYLAEAGRHRFIITDDESWEPLKVLHFFWKLFSSQSGITVRVGKPMDVFGNFVDEEGRSIGPNGTTLDVRRLLTTEGELRSVPQRDQEYTRELGARIAERFHRENTVLTSHLVAFAFFETLRRKYPELDLYRFLRLSVAQRALPFDEFLAHAASYQQKLRAAADRGELYLCDELQGTDVRAWVEDGARQLGLLHDAAVVKVREGAIWTEDMTLLYYYRNRLAGYGLSLLAEGGELTGKPGQNDSKGFLA